MLQIQKWALDELHIIEEFFTFPSSLLIYLKHIQDLERLKLDDMNEDETTVLRAYINQLMTPFRELLNSYATSFSKTFPVIESLITFWGERAKALKELPNLVRRVIPSDLLNNKTLILANVNQWVLILEEEGMRLHKLHQAMITFIIVRHKMSALTSKHLTN